MTVTTQEVKCSTLDPITVYWHDYEPGKGMVTIVCYGQAWAAYFGAMSGRTIQQFFAGSGVDYLVNKLGTTRKVHDRYLTNIVKAIKQNQNNSDKGEQG